MHRFWDFFSLSSSSVHIIYQSINYLSPISIFSLFLILLSYTYTNVEESGTFYNSQGYDQVKSSFFFFLVEKSSQARSSISQSVSESAFWAHHFICYVS